MRGWLQPAKLSNSRQKRFRRQFRRSSCNKSYIYNYYSNEKIISTENVLTQMITTADYYITRTMTNRTCQLTMGRETMPFIHLFMGVPKKSPYVMEFNKE